MKTTKGILTLAIIALSFTLVAQDDFSKQRVSVFKNGTGFFIKSGNINAPSGKYKLNKTPDALFGTIWANADGERIKSIKRTIEKSIEKSDIFSLRDMISANVNKTVRVVPKSGELFDATIFSIESSLVMLQSKDKWISMYVDDIKSLEFSEKPELKYELETDKNQLELEFGSPGTKDVNLMYLQKGIGWFPNYLIEIDNDNKATITLKSTLINDVEDLVNAEIDFVVGVPNFKYNYLMSPLSISDNLENIIRNLKGVGGSPYFGNVLDNRNYLSNSIMTQQAMPAAQPIDAGESGDNEFSMAEGGSKEDLYFYKHKDVNLKKGERATYELMHTKIDFEHVYEVSLPLNNNTYNYYANQTSYDDTKSNKVWHSIKLKNNTQMPWTTGTAMVVKNDGNTTKPISQDMMKYTPIKSNTYLKITVSPDISVKDKDKEVKRQERIKKRGGSYYDLVTVEGSLLLKNFKNKAVKLSIKRPISGELNTSSSDWKFTKVLNNYYNNINPYNDVEWEIELKAGEEKEITYTYTTYIYN